MFGQKYGQKKKTLENLSSGDFVPESETVRKGSKSGAPDEIGRYHMYDLAYLKDSKSSHQNLISSTCHSDIALQVW